MNSNHPMRVDVEVRKKLHVKNKLKCVQLSSRSVLDKEIKTKYVRMNGCGEIVLRTDRQDKQNNFQNPDVVDVAGCD